MADQPTPTPLVTKQAIDDAEPVHLRHPWNPNSDIHLKHLSGFAGLARAIVTLARVPAGKESFVYHAHERDEEWLYILEGRGRAEIDGETFEVGPGDFMGFPTPSVAHHLVNIGDTDLVYLMGGERSGLDVAYFPRHGKTMVFSRSELFAVADEDKQVMSLADYLAKS
jgi:uncharacterized cupin superfamily protein